MGGARTPGTNHATIVKLNACPCCPACADSAVSAESAGRESADKPNKMMPPNNNVHTFNAPASASRMYASMPSALAATMNGLRPIRSASHPPTDCASVVKIPFIPPMLLSSPTVVIDAPSESANG